MKNSVFFSKSLLSFLQLFSSLFCNNNITRLSYLVVLFTLSAQLLTAQQPVDSWTIATTPAPDQDTYTIGLDDYEYGQGNNVEVTSVTYNGNVYTIPFASQSYVFKRVDITPNSDGVNVVGNKASIFFERTGASNFIYEASLPGIPGNIDLEEILKSTVINRGSLDVFKNTGDNSSDQGPSNIERVDVVFPSLTINNAADLPLNGFLASEKSGNNTYKAAAILSLDAFGEPASYGNLVTIQANTSYGIPADNSYNPVRSNAFNEDSNSDNQPIRVGGANERIGISLITFSDLGISAGQTFYGISFFGDDVFDGDNLLDPTTFPQTTGTGADIYGALGAIVTASGFIPPLDTDGDLVIDSVDLDDDNDGIPDAVELACSNGFENISATAVNASIDNTTLHDGSNTPQTLTQTFTTPGCLPNQDVVSYQVTAFPSQLASNTTNICSDVDSFRGFASPNGDNIGIDKLAGCDGGIRYRIEFTSGAEILNLSSLSHGNLASDEAVTITSNVPLIGTTFKRATADASNDGTNGGSLVTNSGTNSVTIDNVSGAFGGNLNIWEVHSNGVPITWVEIDYYRSAGGTGQSYEAFTLNHTFPCDKDCDGIPNYLDLDSDNDGILDVYEAGGTDADRDGVIDGFTDTDNDGLNDAQDNIDNGSGASEVMNGTPLPVPNTDGTGNVDYLDIDADDDGIVDNIEGQTTVGYNPPLNADDDNDGIDNQYDVDFPGNNSFPIANTDGDALDDYLDRDSDGDGDDDILEAWDSDSNGIPSITPTNMDVDGDGLDDGFDNDITQPDPTNGQVPTDFPDAQEPGGDRDWRDFADIDGDGVADKFDLDNDNDGIPDAIEGTTADSDNDGTPDYLDVDSDNDGVTDAKEAGGIDNDGDGRIDNFVDDDDDGLNDAQDNIDNGSGAGEITNGTPLADTNSDGDALQDRIDRDSDNDGIPDVIEAGGDDTNGNGLIDGFVDTDGDGLGDTVDPIGPAVPGTPLPDTNSDSDPLADRLDVDSDNDGLTDTYEAGGTDANGDGRIDGFVDADNDGFTDTVDTDDSTTPSMPLDGTGIALPRANFDGDGRPDYLDRDSDNDGINDTYEAGGTDADLNGEIDGFTDSNTDGLNDATATTPLPIHNTDTNGNPDHLDIDADDDGIVDNIEGQSTTGYNAPLNADADNDGIDNQYDVDFAGNNAFSVENTDGDALDDYRDLDTDNDTINDSIEGWDINADGTPEVTPANADSDNDGLDNNFDNDDAIQDPTNGQVPTDFPDAQLPGGDRDWRQTLDNDNDGVNDIDDLDDDNDGIPDTVEGTGDTDGDGIPDYLDLDSDNDGIPDILESGSGRDMDGDGQIDYPTPGDPMSLNDTNNDGLDDEIGTTPLPDLDSDNDGLVDRLDLDSDNDGIADIIEAGGTDTNADGQVDYATPGNPMTMVDVDQDGFIDTIDTNDNTVGGLGDGGTALPDFDNDGDLLANRLDLDSDNDGIHDVIESGGMDSDSNGRADDDDDNADNTASNGIPTSAGGGNTPTDTGADGSQDYLNLDSDADGCSDANEAYGVNSADGGDGGQYGTGTPATIGAFGLVTNAAYDTGVVAAVTDDTDNSGCDVLDSDGDGVLDDQETTDMTDPNDPCDFVIASITEIQSGDWLLADCDGDGVTNEQEIADGTNPEDPCDFDAASVTLALSGDYLISDCDGDGVTNGTEIEDGTNPDDPCDFLETSVTLDRSGAWLLADCDGDMISNDQETNQGTNPNDPCSSIGGSPPPDVVCDIIIETDLVNPGVNEGIFQITNIEAYPDNDVKIYNRWGILVFETEGYDNSSRAFRGISNGRATLQMNEELPVGVYFYIINYRGTNSGTKSGYLYVNR